MKIDVKNIIENDKGAKEHRLRDYIEQEEKVGDDAPSDSGMTVPDDITEDTVDSEITGPEEDIHAIEDIPVEEEPEPEHEIEEIPVQEEPEGEEISAEEEPEPEPEIEEIPVQEDPYTEEEPEEETAQEGPQEPADKGPEPEADAAEEKNGIFSRRNAPMFVIGAAFLVLAVLTFVYTSLIPREVNAIINGEALTVDTKAYTVERFLESEGISYCDADYLSVPAEAFIHDGMSLTLEHAADFTVKADGKTVECKTLKRTVEGALEDSPVKVGKDDIVLPAPDTIVGDDMEIVVKRVTYSEHTVEKAVAYDVVKKKDDSMAKGEKKVLKKGKKGRDEVTYRIKFVDGKEVSRTEIDRKVLKKPVDGKIAVGTKISFNGGNFSKKIVVRAYAYTGGGRTAMGTRARVGEIAVDPGVIPLGSTVYIEGVGYRRAEDTGGNIKGNTIDIYMNSRAACLGWGCRTVTVYIK